MRHGVRIVCSPDALLGQSRELTVGLSVVRRVEDFAIGAGEEFVDEWGFVAALEITGERYSPAMQQMIDR